MLKIIGVLELLPESVEIDFYVPIKIRWGNDEDNELPHLFWSIAGNDGYCLLEVGMNLENKAIEVITVVLPGKQIIQDSNVHLDTLLPSKSGIPVCSTDDWPLSGYSRDLYFREISDFEFHVGKNNICIVFIPIQNTVSQIVSGRTRFGLDKNNYLTMVEITKLSDENMKLLKESEEHRQSSRGQEMEL
jgi:hypothetical protein